MKYHWIIFGLLFSLVLNCGGGTELKNLDEYLSTPSNNSYKYYLTWSRYDYPNSINDITFFWCGSSLGKGEQALKKIIDIINTLLA